MGSKDSIQDILKSEFKDIAKKEFKKLNEEVGKLNEYIENNLKDEIKVVEIDTKKPISKLEGAIHENMEQLIKMVSLGLNVLLSGPTGSGKTTCAIQAADSLDLKHYSVSVGQHIITMLGGKKQIMVFAKL